MKPRTRLMGHLLGAWMMGLLGLILYQMPGTAIWGLIAMTASVANMAQGVWHYRNPPQEPATP